MLLEKAVHFALAIAAVVAEKAHHACPVVSVLVYGACRFGLSNRDNHALTIKCLKVCQHSITMVKPHLSVFDGAVEGWR